MTEVKCNEIVIKEYEITIDEEVREYLLDLLQNPIEEPEPAYDKRNREVLWKALNNPYKPPQVVARN